MPCHRSRGVDFRLRFYYHHVHQVGTTNVARKRDAACCSHDNQIMFGLPLTSGSPSAANTLNMSAKKINTVFWQVAGNFEGLDYDGICVIPNLENETILLTIATTSNELKKVAEVPFPISEQTDEHYHDLMKTAILDHLEVFV